MSGAKEKRVLNIREVLEGEYEGREIRMNGAVHIIRHMGEVAFVVLCKLRGLVQCMYGARIANSDIRELKKESAVEIMGAVKVGERAPQGFEIRLKEIRVLSRPAESLPLAVSKWELNTSLETKLSLCPTSLQNVRERAKFKIQEGIIRGFRGYSLSEDFTEIRTPKVVARGAEGGPNVLKLEYFNRKTELGQSPQFYKQTVVGVYDRVFEVAPVFRAEKYNTTRHFNEYTSLDFEMGYIGNFQDMMDVETGMPQCVMKLPEQDYKKELDILGVALPEVGRTPVVRFDWTKELASREYDRKIRNPYDLESEEELLTGRYFQEEYGSDFMFVIRYPSKKRPFYVMDNPADPKFTLSFDLLFQGLGATTGEQRVHDYREVIAKMEKRGVDPRDIVSYLMISKYGIPPHSGLGIGPERLTMRFLDEQNVGETSLFLRDVTRLEP